MGCKIVVEVVHMVERPSAYYAQIYVPPKLRAIVGKSVLRQSLRTKDKKTAIARHDEAMATLRGKLAGLIEEAAAKPANAGADWLAGMVEKSRAKVSELKRRTTEEQALIEWALDQIKQDHPQHPAVAAATPPVPTFLEAATQCIASNRPNWKRDAWTPVLRQHVFKHIGNLPVDAVDARSILQFLKPLAESRPPTAAIVRGYIESILDYARVHGWRKGENPAVWSGNLEHALPALRRKHRQVEHHQALPWRDLPPLFAELMKAERTDSAALAFCILTATRSVEAIGAEWSEIGLAEKLWTIPAQRMKGGRDHRVPLSSAALTIVHRMQAVRQSPYVFSSRKDKMLGKDALRLLLVTKVASGITVHGFRSTFRDWCSDNEHDESLAEAALAHQRGDATERSYNRTDMLERRRKLMEQWADFCTTSGTTS